MADLFKVNCASDIPNTGIAICNPMIANLQGVIFTSTLKEYTAAVLATLVAALKADVLNETKSERLLPFFEFQELTADNTVERPKIVKGSGSVTFGSAKARDFRYEFNNIGLKTFKKIQALNDQRKLYFFGYDEKDQLIGATNAADKLLPIKLQAQCIHEPKYNTDGTVNFYMDLITEDPYAFGSNAVIIDCSATPLTNELSGLYDVTMAATPTALKITLTAEIDVSSEDFFAKYSTEAAVAGAFVCTNAAGAAVVPSVVAYAAGTPSTIALTIVAGTYSVKLEDPVALAALLIGSAADGGYESNTVTGIVVPAA